MLLKFLEFFCITTQTVKSEILKITVNINKKIHVLAKRKSQIKCIDVSFLSLKVTYWNVIHSKTKANRRIKNIYYFIYLSVKFLERDM